MKKENLIIGRQYEQKLIKDYYESPKSELIAIYGRRRVGKTFLIKKVFDEKFDFWFTGMYETRREIHLSQFAKELSKYSGKNIETPKNWFGAFDKLKEYLFSLHKKKGCGFS